MVMRYSVQLRDQIFVKGFNIFTDICMGFCLSLIDA